ncbi:MAG TPA: dephospho-CoA kinase [Candidatus Pelagibacter sp.]|jgi:dephospho-CoA kinase|nr:dephospho-CoA kinase [Candidatus Pelagibacter sp.]
MIRLAVVGDIGSGKSHVAKTFGFPVFNADNEVALLYKKNRKCYNKLKKILPKYIFKFPINKKEVAKAIMANKNNIKKITKIIHPEIKIKMSVFFKKNRNKKFIVLDVPLLIENKINKKGDILIFVDAKKNEVNRRLRRRLNFNLKMMKKFKKLQLPLEFKKKRSSFIIKNNFSNNSVKKNVKKIMEKILLNA